MSANLWTTGTTKRTGHSKVYTPVYLVASVTLAAPPSSMPGAVVSLEARSSSECHKGLVDRFNWSYAPGTMRGPDSDLYVTACDSYDGSQFYEFVPGGDAVVRGRTITWRFKLREFHDLKPGRDFYDINAQTNINDPVEGDEGTRQFAPDSCIDYATTSARWTLQ